MVKAKWILVGAAVIAILVFSARAASADGYVSFSFSIGPDPVYYPTQTYVYYPQVYYQPPVVYHPPRTVYYQPPIVYYPPRVVYYAPTYYPYYQTRGYSYPPTFWFNYSRRGYYRHPNYHGHSGHHRPPTTRHPHHRR